MQVSDFRYMRALPYIVATLALTLSARADGPGPVGQFYAQPPDHLAPLFTTPPAPSIDALRGHLEAHDLEAALWEAGRITDARRWGRDRDAAWMAAGMLHREQGRHNLASAAFTRVRAGNGPLASLGAFYEAEQDLERGRYWVAARECENYRKKYEDGRFGDDCHRMMAVAYAKAGAWRKARDVAKEYDDSHRKAPIREQVELTLTLGSLGDEPEKMIPRLQDHAIDFTAPLTGRVAVETLAELAAEGHEAAVVPSDVASRKRRAYSLRRTKQTHQAWDIFEGLIIDSEDDPALRRWVEGEAETFGWRTRNWDFLAEFYAAKYAERPDSDTAWNHFKVLSRGGRHVEAVAIADTLGKTHSKSRHWRRKDEEVARTKMLAKDYAGARATFDNVARRGGWSGLRASYYAAFSGVMAGDDDEDTLARLGKLIDAGGSYSVESQYWRAQVYDRLERADEASADRQAVLTNAPDTWYGALTRRALIGEATEGYTFRDGRWAGDPAPSAPEFTAEPAPLFASSSAPAAPAFGPDRPAATGFAMLKWSAASDIEVATPSGPALVERDPNHPPASYAESALFDKSRVARDFRKYSKKHATAWPELEAAYDLSRVGLYDLSGPLFSAIYEEWRSAYRNRANRKHMAARSMKLDANGWRGLFNFVRDHHHTARFNNNGWKSVEDPELAVAARKIGYPLAHDRFVWTHAREHGVDPYLVLGLMRQESTYNSIARSPVGASGAMQIMPRTGHLMANLQHDLRFTAGDLEDPILSVGYGIAYLGLLMERFDDAYPLAIASYNGGPFNVSSWLRGTGDDMPMDAFVEHIPFRETRDYVKKVSAGYTTYLTLYAPEKTVLAPPPTPRGDHPEVVDF